MKTWWISCVKGLVDDEQKATLVEVKPQCNMLAVST